MLQSRNRPAEVLSARGVSKERNHVYEFPGGADKSYICFFPSTTFVSVYVRARGVFEYITYPVIACIAEATLVAPVIVYRLEFVRSVLSAAKAT